MLVIVAPGQGAQTPGFLTPWLDVEGATDRLRWWSAVTGLDLIEYGTKADAETIRDTAVAQPLLVAAGLLGTFALFPDPADAVPVVGGVAGHSVGELTAAAGAQVITPESAMVLVRERGRAMAAAAAVEETSMVAVLGGDEATVLAAIEAHGLTPANVNGAGQIVAAGTVARLEAFRNDPPQGVRLRALSVAGAFHTHHMAPAVSRLAELVPGVTVRDPHSRYISNADGAVVHGGREILGRIVDQVSAPVRWDQCMNTMAELGVTAVIEVPPAGTLTGLIRRALPGVRTVALKTPDDLPAARALVEEHGSASPLEGAPTWRLVLAPFRGTFEAAAAPAGATVVPGARIGVVRSTRERTEVTAEHGGTIVEWLVEDGDPVSPGQPLARLHPVTSS